MNPVFLKIDSNGSSRRSVQFYRWLKTRKKTFGRKYNSSNSSNLFSGSVKALLEWSEFVQIYAGLRVSCIATASMRLGHGEFSSDDRARFVFVRTKLPVLIG